MRRAIIVSVILLGFTAMASQIVFMREFLTVFYGNELSIGFMLASWLIGGAIGSALFGKAADRIRSRISAFSLCQVTVSILIVVCLLALRSIKTFLGVSAGEMIPLFPMIISSFLIVAPVCIVLGWMFSLACRIYDWNGSMAATRIGRVYILEALGAIIGGLTVSFILIPLVSSLRIIAVIGSLNILLALLLQPFSERTRMKPVLTGLLSILFLAVSSMWLFGAWNALERRSLKNEWRGYELVASKNSIYGNVALTRRPDQFSFFSNGLHLYTIPDEVTREEAVHFALLEHPDPKDVLLVGGGVGGLAEEILKHPVERVDYVELDPLIIKMAGRYLPHEYYKALEDPAVSVVNVDGRRFIKNTDKRYDCVIIHLGNPYTAQINRYYTVEFFKELRRILKKRGVVSFALTSSENYINPDLKRFLRSIYLTLKEAFGDVRIIPGDTAYFLASPEGGSLTCDPDLLVHRIRERRLNIRYVREYYLFSKLSPQRISYIEDSVKEGEGVQPNYDFRPISYYYDIIFWTAHFRESLFSRFLKGSTESRIRNIALVLCATIILAGLASLKSKRAFGKASLAAVMTTGFSEIAFQIVVLLSFQIIYGYVFYKLGLILTSFMIGLALGGRWIVKAMPTLKRPNAAFIWTQASIVVYPLMLVPFFWWLSSAEGALASWLGSNVLFPFLPVVAGFIGGFQFPLANRIYIEERGGEMTGRAAGLSYGLDLLGSALGAFFTLTFLIPAVGIPKTCLLVASVNLSVLVLLVLTRAGSR